MDKRDERRELIKALAVARNNDSVRTTVGFDNWMECLGREADALLAALDQHSPPTRDESTAAAAGEPKERVCVWTLKHADSFRRDGIAACTQVCWPRGGAMTFCPDCGGKIITEGQS